LAACCRAAARERLDGEFGDLLLLSRIEDFEIFAFETGDCDALAVSAKTPECGAA